MSFVIEHFEDEKEGAGGPHPSAIWRWPPATSLKWRLSFEPLPQYHKLGS